MSEQLNFLVTYSMIFFIFAYMIDFNALSNHLSQVLGNNFSVYVFATLMSHRNIIFIINEPNPYERYQLNFLVTYSIKFFYFRM